MIDVYIKAKDLKHKKYVHICEDYFDEHYKKEFIDDLAKHIIAKIDGGKCLKDGRIKSKYGPIISIKELSSGCKTCLVVYQFPDIIFDTVACGRNAFELICTLPAGKIYISLVPYYSRTNPKVEILLHVGNEEIEFSSINGLVGYYCTHTNE